MLSQPIMEDLSMAYAMEFREAVARAYDECGSSIEVAEQFNCSESWVRRLIQRRRETGSLAPRPNRLPNNNKLDDADMERLRKLILQTPDMTLAELAEALDNKVSVPTVWRATQTLGLPFKKSPSTPSNKTVRTSKRSVTRGSTGSPRRS
jgi:transposase